MRALFAVALTGCSSLFGLDDPKLIDAAGEDSAKQLCLGEGEFRICAPQPTKEVTLTTVLSTDTGCDLVVPSNGQQLCVVTGTTIRIAGDPTHPWGSRPLVLFASASIEISGLLDASSRTTNQITGPGAAAAPCPTLQPGSTSVNGSGGGAGGSFGGNGGTGGGGDLGATSGALAAVADGVPMFLRAGCAGSRGGGLSMGPSGLAGGAVYLVAGAQIRITDSGKIDASGSGGAGGVASKGGGSGGGSGGMIALWAPTIDFTGTLVANGGGGGGGADNGAGGVDGSDMIAWDAPSPGGLGGGSVPCGIGPGCGGDGGWRSANAQNGGQDKSGAGGGGGGGSVGWIRVLSRQRLGGMTSPDPVPN